MPRRTTGGSVSGFVLASGPGIAASVDSMSAILVHRGSARVEVRGVRTGLVGLNRSADGFFAATTACVDGIAVLVDGWIENSHSLLGSHPGQSLAHALAAEYGRVGVGALGRLRGAFVIAVADEPAGRLLLHRDFQGQRPGYYWSDGRVFLAASEVKAIARHPAYRARFDASVLAHLLVTGVEPYDRALAGGVFKIPPGYLVEWVEGAAPATRPLVELNVPVEPITVAEGADRLSSLLHDGLAARLNGHRRVGVFLSGGVDSYLVAAHLADQAAVETHAGTGGLVGDARDETAAAIARARALDIAHTAVPWPERRERETLFDLLRWTVAATEQPGRYENALLVRHLLRNWPDMPPVLLTGDMADVLFGDPYYRALDRAELLQTLLPSLALRRRFAASLELLPLRQTRSLAELARLDRHDFRLYFGGIFRHEGADRLLGFDPFETIQVDYRRLVEDARRLSRSQRYCLVHLRSSGQGSIDKLERLVSAAGGDLVHPFLMDDVFHLAFSLPPSSKYRRGRTKLVPRTLAARTLSPGEAWGRRMGFSAPRSEWIIGDESLREGVTLLREPGARVRDVVDGGELDRLVTASGQAGGEAHADLVWVLLSVEVWARELESR